MHVDSNTTIALAAATLAAAIIRGGNVRLPFYPPPFASVNLRRLV